MKTIKLKQKKALSEIVSYVLLIVIAVSLSVAVYAWLKVYIPKNTVECEDGVSLIIKDYSCDTTSNKLTITFQNKGLYDIDGVYIKIANTSQGNTIYLPEPQLNPFGPSKPGFFYFGVSGLVTGMSANQTFNYTRFSAVRKVQIQSFVLRNNEIVLCNKDTKTQDIGGCY
jgi:flagellin-like protein